MSRRYITTAIPYVNSKPHLGFAMELVQTDVMARHWRHRGHDVRFLTGTDDNSLKNAIARPKRRAMHRPLSRQPQRGHVPRPA